MTKVAVFSFFLVGLSHLGLSQQAVLKFESNNGTITESVNGLVLTNNGAIASVDHNGGSAAMYYNGSSNYVTTPHAPILDFDSSDFSVCVWAKFDTSESFGRNSYVIFQKGHSGTSNAQVILRYNTNSQDIQLLTNDLNQSYTTTTLNATATSFEDGLWHHLVAVRASNKLEVFMDGVSIGNKSVQSVDINTSGAFTIGSQNPDLSGTSFHNFFTGSIGELLIFKESLNETFIANTCQAEAPNEVKFTKPNKAGLSARILGNKLILTSNVAEIESLRVLSLNGEIVYENRSNQSGFDVNRNMKNLAAGTYIIQATRLNGESFFDKINAPEGITEIAINGN